MLDPAIVAALVALISALVKAFLPQFPISDELITAVVITILGWLGLEVFKFAAPRLRDRLHARGLMK